MALGWIVVPVSLAYLGLLFLIAWYGDKKPQWMAGWRPWIYSLSIAVYCTSWTFYGTVGQASQNIWSFLPIYLAPILVFTVGWRILARLVLIAKREHITSIADFIAARYGKSQGLAVVVTLIAVIGILPYIALQLRGITMGLAQIAPSLGQQSGVDDSDIAWMVTAALAVFTVLFGTRHIDSTEHHRGMMMAVAFESIVKLVAFLIVGVFALGLLADLPVEALAGALDAPAVTPDFGSLLIHMLLTMAAIICLPRQFHTIVVENSRAQDLHLARWVFPGYLLLMGLFVVPLALAGQALLPGVVADTYVINLPLLQGADEIALLAFLGGTSAATGMVIVSTIALTIMVSNDLVLPLLLRRLRISGRNFAEFSGLLLNVRRTLILLLLTAAWGFHQVLDEIESLSAIGFLSFAAIAQFAPALLGGIYWREGNRKGVYAGMLGGLALWVITMMNQTQMLAGSAETNLLLWLLTPPQWPVLKQLAPVDWGMLLSLLVNLALYVAVSLLTRTSLTERLQAATFVGAPLPDSENASLYQTRVTVAELEMLAARFVGRKRVRYAFSQFAEQHHADLLPQQQAPATLIRHTERVLAGVFGASSARLVLTSALQGRNMQLEEVATIVDEASELFDFSRGLLQGAIEHISQGIAVVDKQLRLVAWNQRYLELFSFPPGLIQVGRPIADVIRHNAQQGLCGPGDPERHVAKRVEHLKRGTAHTSSRIRPDGQVIEVQGNPMPGGGFVMSFSDITDFRLAEEALKEANENLEARVRQRTRELELLNRQLVSATQQAEQQARSKSRFLAAVSHDLMQPLNAARLFSSSLTEVAKDPQAVAEVVKLAQHIESALGGAEDLIGDLLDVSRLEAGKLQVNVRAFPASEVLDTLSAEFSALAREQGLTFEVVNSRAVIVSDPKLLRRALQNFLTNAFRYNPGGKVVLGIRRSAERLQIQVWDNGPGIPEEKQAHIFEEFTRIERNGVDHGLGLGLAIARGICRVLDHPLAMRSWPGQGTVFELGVARGVAVEPVVPDPVAPVSAPLAGLKVLCVDNEPDILLGMDSLLSRWGCEVRLAETVSQAMQRLDDGWRPDFVLSDYHLTHQQTGLQVLHQCCLRLGKTFKGVVISADRTDEIQQAIRGHGFGFISKPVKPLKLRALLNQHRREIAQEPGHTG
ncbi:PAS domain-containing hybrid sensor histidine kinase/response regulator [Photobacterium sp. TY1-4]|uniref:hybrid sensor histidine kinase/response regulator n=1 Tax=Photobacterium sp. TY1-4 TaxID=2899122 RepID=UPI0021BF6E31|nr:PAS domain-containing hybrid sensor histidine kinase/response regulator [Photobacterium sp. TY1-4]UXI01112.1 hybrid sensor histidine kinase/response regulator [Photobacterium sp. TY1-4]